MVQTLHRVMNGEKWRIITPVLVSVLTIFSTINLFVMDLMRKEIHENSVRMEAFTERVHRIENWQAEVEGNRFKAQNGVKLKDEILAVIDKRFPFTEQWKQRVTNNSSEIVELKHELEKLQLKRR